MTVTCLDFCLHLIEPNDSRSLTYSQPPLVARMEEDTLLLSLIALGLDFDRLLRLPRRSTVERWTSLPTSSSSSTTGEKAPEKTSIAILVEKTLYSRPKQAQCP
jgi:hypothetical protein